MPGSYYFAILGHMDNPIFELEYANKPADLKRDDLRHLNQFVAYSALDIIDEQMWSTNNMYLKVVDKFNDWHVSSFVTAGKLRFVMLHDERGEENIRHFFQEIYEIYIKLSINPFYEHNKPIKSAVFYKKAQVLAKKYLN